MANHIFINYFGSLVLTDTIPVTMLLLCTYALYYPVIFPKFSIIVHIRLDLEKTFGICLFLKAYELFIIDNSWLFLFIHIDLFFFGD